MDKAVINGKTYILVPEEMYNETPEEPERLRTGYEQKPLEKGDTYYSDGVPTRFCNDENDRANFERGLFETDERLSYHNRCADTILRRMRQWQALNDVVVDFGSDSRKWHIYYDKTIGELKTDFNQEYILSFVVYFSSRAKAEEALEVFRDDLLWLHTEYRRRLDEVRNINSVN